MAAGELRRVKSGSKVDEMLKKAEADDVTAFGRLHFEDAPTEYFDAEEERVEQAKSRKVKSKYKDSESKISAVSFFERLGLISGVSIPMDNDDFNPIKGCPHGVFSGG